MMKYFRKKQAYWFTGIIAVFLLLAFTVIYASDTSETLPVGEYYGYDKAIPLRDSINLLKDTTDFTLYHITYNSVHDKKVTGLLSLPKNISTPIPVVILMHGLGDNKNVDYLSYGNDLFLKNGYAVLRIDFSGHGERKGEVYDFSLTGKYKYWSRNIISQTVFDLRRAVDFIETRNELDASRIGYYGISLGGITGTVFCGVEDRIKVPIVALAGGQMNLLYEKDALTEEAKNFVSFIEPLNFVKQIAPRPFLMLNAKNDEIVPPIMSTLLFKAAQEPKEIIWYDAKHRDAPLDIIYGDGLNWFKKYL
ncbi:alpha/beta hydrolase [Arenibacter echinorum]|uniref:Cephalosporin-C deacetylase-like acetyl esterase n=1 Tax=Arenibacter echinorum TaxID=440515 RepID=A0A327R7P6_9FLAO|nr:alpha/beta fold hydrolase [Arenibacter echinorum]RAJ09967.1 cephalosporin-C deacetylase-like acetyl esterase [Arenibacter echinorum]